MSDTTEFELKGEYIELIKLLKVVGFCNSGGEAKSAVNDGLIKVDTIVETRKRRKIRRGQSVTYRSSSVSVV